MAGEMSRVIADLGDAFEQFKKDHRAEQENLRARLEAVEDEAARPPMTGMPGDSSSEATEAFIRYARTGIRDGMLSVKGMSLTGEAPRRT